MPCLPLQLREGYKLKMSPDFSALVLKLNALKALYFLHQSLLPNRLDVGATFFLVIFHRVAISWIARAHFGIYPIGNFTGGGRWMVAERVL